MKVKRDGDSLIVTLPAKAITEKNGSTASALVAMPRNRGYDGYKFYVGADKIKMTDERMANVTLRGKGGKVTIKKAEDTKDVTLDEMEKIFSGTSEEDYMVKKYRVSLPWNAVDCFDSTSVTVRCKRAGKRALYVFSAAYVDAKNTDENHICVVVPDYAEIAVLPKFGMKVIPPEEFVGEFTKMKKFRGKMGKVRITIPTNALVKYDEELMTFKLPKGKYEGKTVSFPDTVVKKAGYGFFDIEVPFNKMTKVRSKNGDTEKITSITLNALTVGSIRASYEYEI